MKELSDDVLRKIGRNVLLFQQIESQLKYLVANHCIDGTEANILERKALREADIKKQMMGNLIKQYTDGILSDAGEVPNELEDITSTWISFKFTTTGDKAFYESQRADMQQMVNERNDLIHHFLPRWQPDSVEHLTNASSYLDQQHEKMLPMFEHFKVVTKSMNDSKQLSAEFLGSSEVEHQFELMWLQLSPLVTLLEDVAMQKARSDGWAYLSHAGDVARTHESYDVKNMKERYGYSTLKQILVASELFDVLDEKLPNAQYRTLYRIKK